VNWGLGARRIVTPTFVPAQTVTRHLDVFGSVLLTGTGTVTSDTGGISCTVSGSSVGTGTCGADLPDGTVVTLTATPAAGSSSPTWDVWSPGAPCAPGATCTVAMDDARTVAAGFERIPTVRFTVNSAAMAGFPTGRITSSPAGIDCVPDYYMSPGTCTLDVPAGTEVTLTAAPATDYVFTSLAYSSGATTCTTSPCVITVSAATTATATFTRLAQRTINVMTSGSPFTMANGAAGTVTAIQGGASCTFSVCMAPNHPLNGMDYMPCYCYPLTTETVVLKATPNSGYAFDGWSLGCTSVNTAGDECTIGPDSSGSTVYPTGSFSQP